MEISGTHSQVLKCSHVDHWIIDTSVDDQVLIMASVSSTVNANVTCTCGNGQCFLILAQLGPWPSSSFPLEVALQPFQKLPSTLLCPGKLPLWPSLCCVCVLRASPPCPRPGHNQYHPWDFVLSASPKSVSHTSCVRYWFERSSPFCCSLGRCRRSSSPGVCSPVQCSERGSETQAQVNKTASVKFFQNKGKPNDKTTGTLSGAAHLTS